MTQAKAPGGGGSPGGGSGLITGVVYRHDCGQYVTDNPCEWDGQEITVTLTQPESGVVELPTLKCERIGCDLTFVSLIRS